MATRKKAAATGTDVATTEEKQNLPAQVHDYGEDFGDGLQDIGQQEVGVPFLKILQAQSPEVIGPNGKIEGAQAGMILNTGTEELHESVQFVPALRQHVFVEWRPRKQGGGIVAIHQPTADIVRAAIDASEEFGKYKTEAGNDLVETFYVFGILLDENEEPTGMVVVPFASTAIKKYKRQFMNRVKYCMVTDAQGRKRNPPMFAHRVRISTAQESNDDGTWSNYRIEFAVENNALKSLMTPDHPGYQAAKGLKAAVESGEAQADTSKAERGGDGVGDGGSAF